jgi:pseudaminic acid biosynthesis-associated methylase
MQTQSTIDLWKSSFGDDYTHRNNSVDIGARRKLWELILPKGCQSILEVGANVGLNLDALAQITAAEMYAVEPNDTARDILASKELMPERNILSDAADKIGFPDSITDLVFTSGVLIHIPSEKLEASMREIYRLASKWIICGEYFAPSEEMVPYRGHDGAMWRRDYGSLYLDMFPNLKCKTNLFAWKRMTGLDNLTFWVFEK